MAQIKNNLQVLLLNIIWKIKFNKIILSLYSKFSEEKIYNYFKN